MTQEENTCLSCGEDSPCGCDKPMPAAETYAKHRAQPERFEPYCDCLGGNVQMIPDPNGRWGRADRAAPDGQVRAKIEGLIEDAIANAEVDYPAGREAGHSITWASDRLLDDIMALITPPPAAPTGNTALVEALRPFGLISTEGVVTQTSGHVTITTCAEYFHRAAAALASREAPPAAQESAAWKDRICTICDGGPGNDGPCLCGMEKWNAAPPPACQQEAATVAEDDILADAEAAYWADPNNDSFDRHCIRATLRALKGGAA